MRRRSTILIVDDEQYILNALKRLFMEDSITVLEAENPQQAFSLLKEHLVDLILSDEMMPKMSGVEFFKEVRKEYPDIIRIMLTGASQFETAVKAVNEGEVYRFLTKPWDPANLRTLVLQALKLAEVERESKGPVEEKKRQLEAFGRLETDHPGITDVAKDEKGSVVIPELDDM